MLWEQEGECGQVTSVRLWMSQDWMSQDLDLHAFPVGACGLVRHTAVAPWAAPLPALGDHSQPLAGPAAFRSRSPVSGTVQTGLAASWGLSSTGTHLASHTAWGRPGRRRAAGGGRGSSGL